MKTAKRGPRDLAKKTIPQLQATLWPLFAEWVKRNWSPDGIYVKCFTCDKPLRIGDRDCQAGHYIPRTYSPTKYDENNVRVQCSRCNEFHAGQPVEFEHNLRLEVGDDVVDELKARALQPWKWDRGYLMEKITYYREQLRDMA